MSVCLCLSIEHRRREKASHSLKTTRRHFQADEKGELGYTWTLVNNKYHLKFLKGHSGTLLQTSLNSTRSSQPKEHLTPSSKQHNQATITLSVSEITLSVSYPEFLQCCTNGILPSNDPELLKKNIF